MSTAVLVTGGAGFIGRYVVKALKDAGYEPRVLDVFHTQVHGDAPRLDAFLDDVEIIYGDVRDAETVGRALQGVDHVIHLAAEVGVGQSMYEISRYVSVNEHGTSVLFQEISRHPIRRVVVASSMSIYGEGLYCDAAGNAVEDARRVYKEAQWDPCDRQGVPLKPVPTPEWKRPSLSSVYALNKFAQEQMTLIVSPTYGSEAVALRLFNVYGPGQALSNPYTGVLAIFAARILNGNQPLIFEDGKQRRDFVHVRDVARAFVLALERREAAGQIFNIASGISVSIEDMAHRLLSAMNRTDIEPEITGRMRAGDIRHCIADISKAKQMLGFVPQCDLSAEMSELSEWIAGQTADDRVYEARHELEQRGLVL